ncbi:hypothetical protein PVAP13_9NG122373 [Panicum virgatum]|uniref:Uncharacterized protein n=1 Tax=Panicum virgatum TaxID=38727 RepID=A0A8T0MJU1_PANVG|nr:hypothetical protein PVAP13_9NG122373 [Panicum virgatum]
MQVKSGQQTRFWLDVWLGDCPLKITFCHLYSFCRDQEMSVSQAFRNGEWCIPFRRSLTPADLEEWRSLSMLLTSVCLVDGRDEMIWVLENKRTFTTKSL